MDGVAGCADMGRRTSSEVAGADYILLDHCRVSGREGRKLLVMAESFGVGRGVRGQGMLWFVRLWVSFYMAPFTCFHAEGRLLEAFTDACSTRLVMSRQLVQQPFH